MGCRSYALALARYPYPECGTLAFTFTLYADAPSATVGNALADAEAESGALHIVVQLYEALEYDTLLLLGDAGTCVLTVHAYATILIAVAHLDMPLMGVFHGVGGEVGDDLLESSLVNMGE